MMPADTFRDYKAPLIWAISLLLIVPYATFCESQTIHNDQEESQAEQPTTQKNQDAPAPQQEKEEPQNEQPSTPDAPAQEAEKPYVKADRIIRNIYTIGNKTVPTEALLNYIPYRVGEMITVQSTGQIERSAQLVRNLYKELKRFRNITVFADLIEPDDIDIYIVVEEKTPLKDITFSGNKNLPEKEIRKKIDLAVPAIDAEELKSLAEQMKKLYHEKGFQNVTIETELKIDESDGKATAEFTFTEGDKSRIRRVRFEGNHSFGEKDLKNVTMFSKEEWILSFLDKSGTYYPDRIDGDKHFLEQFYQNNGYLHAKVIDVKVEPEPGTNILTVTFVIEEGDKYTIKKVEAPGNDLVSEEFLVANIPIRAGQYYSRDAIGNTIKQMETLWGNMGYIFASIEPAVTVDEDAKTVNISFISDIGKKITLNRISIKGNKKTRDKVIRRRIPLSEGSPLTQGAMDSSKNSIASLGYFDQQDGVNWKVRRINDEEADLDLMIKEAKTGHASVQLSFGGADKSIESPLSAINLKVGLADTNLFGTGTAVNIEGNWSKDEQTVLFHLAQPWLFDKPISGAMDIYHKRPSYDQLKHTIAVNSRVTGGAFTIGFITNPRWHIFNSSQALFSLGLDSIKYNSPPQIIPFTPRDVPKGITTSQANQQYSDILQQEFTPGGYLWLANNLEQDKRNHPMHPSRGQKWKISSKIAVPSIDMQSSGIQGDDCQRRIGFGKLFLDYLWFTPLIGERDLVFKIHLFFGLASPYSNKVIPFGELFHIGGDTTVRGFSYGEIGPKFLGDTIGGKKAFYMNAELMFPITPDLTMKGVVFYDGGAAWDNPYANCASPGLITDNSFDYRHAVGFGLRMLQPMPVRVDWGFKLDARTGEKESQVHFGMTYDW